MNTRRIVRRVLPLAWAGVIISAGISALAQTETSVPFVTVARGLVSRIHEFTRLVIRDQASWQSLWRRHSSSPAAPRVDFSRDMVIAIFAGEFDESMTLTIARIVREPNQLVVQYRVGPARPELDGPNFLPSAPFHLVRVSRVTLPVAFQQITTPPVGP